MDPLVGLFGADDEVSGSDSEDFSFGKACKIPASFAVGSPSGTPMELMTSMLPPEVEEGNIEYKRKLVSVSATRLEHLVTQMKWRLQEGQGEAIYEIGVADHGQLMGLTDEEFEESLSTLGQMATRLGAAISILRERDLAFEEPCKRAVEVLVRKVPDDQQFIDLRVSVLGGAQSGKSTLLGVLSNGELDNGRGEARLNLFRHKHEVQTGHTSSISYEIVGFDSDGKLVNYSTTKSRTAEEVCELSTKLICFVDLAGHHKYMRTTIFSLSSLVPDFALVTVAASSGPNATTREHLSFAHALGVPTFVVVTKSDAVSEAALQKTIQEVQQLVQGPGINQTHYLINNADDAIHAAAKMASDKITPIFTVSSVTGHNLDLLRQFLNVLPPTWQHSEREKLTQLAPIFQVDSVYSVPDVGTVVGGLLRQGSIRQGDTLRAYPTETGKGVKVTVNSIHRNRLPRRQVNAGQAASLSLALPDLPLIRKGMALVTEETREKPCWQFDAKIYVLHGELGKGFQATVYIGSVCQTAVVEGVHGKELQDEKIKTGENAVVTFSFINDRQPEFIMPGWRVLFRGSRGAKGMGEVKRIRTVTSGEPHHTSGEPQHTADPDR